MWYGTRRSDLASVKGGVHHVFSRMDNRHAYRFMKWNEARNDGNDQRNDKKPSQNMLQCQQSALLLQYVVEGICSQLHSFVYAMPLCQTAA